MLKLPCVEDGASYEMSDGRAYHPYELREGVKIKLCKREGMILFYKY